MKAETKTVVEKRKLTRKEKEELVKKLYDEGYTYREIAKELRISFRDISRILKREERKDAISELFEKISRLEEKFESLNARVRDISLMVTCTFGNAMMHVYCPRCRKWSYIVYDREKGWVCTHCEQSPLL